MTAQVARAGQTKELQSYTFTANPRPINTTRPKYRNGPAGTQKEIGPANIMWDPRVIRGNTYAAHILPLNAQPDPMELQREAELRRKKRLRKQKKALEKAKAQQAPEPVPGRQHREIQTELYLEEITDQVVEKDVEVQTDQFLDRPPSPEFVPVKLGIDVETQIYEGDLFNFDVEVEPILEVLVGKTLEQALMEVLEEEEIENMRAHQREFQELRDAELAETQRLEEAERRRHEEKERRLQQERVRIQLEKEAREKVAARAYAQHYLSDLMGSVFGSLKETGFFYDTVERDVETAFVPDLMKKVEANLERVALSRQMLDLLVESAVHKRDERREAHLQFLRDEAERLRQEELARLEREKQAAEEAEAKRKAAEEAAARGEADGGDEEDQPESSEEYDDSEQ